MRLMMLSGSEEFMNAMKQAKIIGGASSQERSYKIVLKGLQSQVQCPSAYQRLGMRMNRSPKQKGEKGGRTWSAQRLELENHDKLYAYLVDAHSLTSNSKYRCVYRRRSRNPGAHDRVISSSNHEATWTLSGID
ncbi:hypothetical protein M9H77_11529 [Catharanthus roseus]|uniref:Uncharacterized protein n=1 Tax=Catharanthus roseus TaxID=4058 RepID=A0ACC0BES3_CATRO|nr:hypothetical protein M9H77_11529 [Catharanthus roseus]